MKQIEIKKNKLVEKIAIMVAEQEANMTCPFISYQPKEPETVKKLRKC